MPKIKTSFTLSAEVIDLLKQLAEKQGRSSANMLEQLVKDEAAKQKIKGKKK